ncbi:MAG: MFS transporter [Sulfolobaceae archaeon]
MTEYKRSEVIKVAAAGVMGTTIEWYDFFIAGTAATIAWPQVFFPSKDPATSLLNSIISFGVGFIGRPIGAILFGHFGDKLGRKNMLIWTLLTMGIGTLGIGLTPPYNPMGGWIGIGVLAGILVTIFRLIQSLGVGGEWGGATALVAEFTAKSKYRAFWGSWVQQGVPFGLIAANGVFLALSTSLSQQDFLSWGWRVPFYIGAIVIVIGIIIRYKISETPLFKRFLETRQVEKVPFATLLKEQWKTVLLLAIGWWYVNSLFYIITSFSQGYLVLLGFTRPFATFTVLIASVIAVFITVLGSVVADKIGRRPVLLISSISSGLLSIPYILMLNLKDPIIALLAQIMLLNIVLFGYAVLPAYFAEHYPTKYRYTGTAFTYHIASPFSGGLAPIIAGIFVASLGGASAAAIYIGLLGLAYGISSAIAIFLARETVKSELKE